MANSRPNDSPKNEETEHSPWLHFGKARTVWVAANGRAHTHAHVRFGLTNGNVIVIVCLSDLKKNVPWSLGVGFLCLPVRVFSVSSLVFVLVLVLVFVAFAYAFGSFPFLSRLVRVVQVQSFATLVFLPHHSHPFLFALLFFLFRRLPCSGVMTHLCSRPSLRLVLVLLCS